MRTLGIIAGVFLAWLWRREPDPRRWPDRLRREWRRLELDLGEAVQAGRQAEARRHRGFDADVAAVRASHHHAGGGARGTGAAR